MVKIIVSGEASTDYPNLQDLHGIDCQDNFSKYFDSNMSFTKDVTGGYMSFVYNKQDGKLYTETVYNSKRLLTEDELNQLAKYTQGQWSDGIGEGFEQHPCFEADEPYQKYDPNYDDYNDQDDADMDLDVYISPWCMGQKLIVEQKEI